MIYKIRKILKIKSMNIELLNNDEKLKSKVLTANGEAPKPYVALIVASMLSTSIIVLCESWVSWDTCCIFVHIIC